MSKQQKRDSPPRPRWLSGCLGMIALCAGLSYAQWFFWGYVPLSTLPVVTFSPKPSIDEICLDPFADPSSHSLYSPDGKYYIDVGSSPYRDAWEVRLFRASDHQLLGTHSYRFVSIGCWEKDNGGIYVLDEVPPSFFFPHFPPFPKPGSTIAVRKLLIPCQSSLAGVSLLPRLYWEIRCALPGSEYSPFAIWFPLVLLLFGVGATVVVARRLWVR